MTDAITADFDRLELIAQLCTQAGMIMEDASAVAVQRPPDKVEQLSRRLAKLLADTEIATALLVAAERLVGPR
jgi:hypothetical protein